MCPRMQSFSPPSPRSFPSVLFTLSRTPCRRQRHRGWYGSVQEPVSSRYYRRAAGCCGRPHRQVSGPRWQLKRLPLPSTSFAHTRCLRKSASAPSLFFPLILTCSRAVPCLPSLSSFFLSLSFVPMRPPPPPPLEEPRPGHADPAAPLQPLRFLSHSHRRDKCGLFKRASNVFYPLAADWQ